MTSPLRLILILLLLFPVAASAEPQVKDNDTFPWQVKARTNINVRSGPGTEYGKIGLINQGSQFPVLSKTDNGWLEIRYDSHPGYISGKYVDYLYSYQKEKQKKSSPQTKSVFSGGFWDVAYEIAKFIAVIAFIIGLVLSSLASEFAPGVAMFWGFFVIGYIVGLIFGNAHIGASIGQMIGTGVALLQLAFVSDFSITNVIWKIISFPFFLLNKIQFYLAKPWRPLMKSNSVHDNDKKALRIILRCLQFPFYVVSTPLRLLNAIYYNLIVHLLYEASNYLLEVFFPSDDNEGHNNFGSWILWLPKRIVVYLVYHLGLTVIESIVWTIVDTFIPALTLYHGTRSQFAEEMVCEPRRNRRRRKESGWTTGTWTVGAGNYAGDGIYFGISRRTLENYQRGAAIVCRVTVGKCIDVSLMPDRVYATAGDRNAHEISRWGIMNGYTSGEWWREGCNWWEICLYDRKNRYNYSWRIRPIYVIDYYAGIMQRIKGGSAHWLFRKMVFKDIGRSVKELFSKK